MNDLPQFDQNMMRQAIELSREKMNDGHGGPFGAIIAQGQEIIGQGFNAVTSLNDPTAHAEVMAIRNACQSAGNFSLEGCTIYTSCEPCPMCLAAIYWARLSRIVFANSRQDAAQIGFDDEFLYREICLPPEQREIPIERMMASDAKNVFQQWSEKTDRIPY